MTETKNKGDERYKQSRKRKRQIHEGDLVH